MGELLSARRGKGGGQGLGARRADTRYLAQAGLVELQPGEQMRKQAGIHQHPPGSARDAAHCQRAVAGEPGQAGQKLLLAAFRRLQAAKQVITRRVRRVNRAAQGAAADHAVDAGNAQPGQSQRDLVAGTDVERLPALE